MIPVITSPILANPPHDHISAQKHRLFLEKLSELAPSLVSPAPEATLADLELAHFSEYVEGIMDGSEANGFGTYDLGIARHSLASVGAMAQGAEMVALTGGPVICAPVHGFHHAGWDFNSGFCTFNGLIVALQKFRRAVKDPGAPVLIIDLDAHYGDGTADIIRRRQLSNIRHITHGPKTLLGQRTWGALTAQLQRLDDELSQLKADGRLPKLCLYQAGADAWIDDPFQAGYLDIDELKMRDMWVFKTCKRYGIPVVWNLAGGYSDMEKVLEIHVNTWKACQEVFE